MTDLIVLQFIANLAGCIGRNRRNDNHTTYPVYRNGRVVRTIGG